MPLFCYYLFIYFFIYLIKTNKFLYRSYSTYNTTLLLLLLSAKEMQFEMNFPFASKTQINSFCLQVLLCVLTTMCPSMMAELLRLVESQGSVALLFPFLFNPAPTLCLSSFILIHEGLTKVSWPNGSQQMCALEQILGTQVRPR